MSAWVVSKGDLGIVRAKVKVCQRSFTESTFDGGSPGGTQKSGYFRGSSTGSSSWRSCPDQRDHHRVGRERAGKAASGTPLPVPSGSSTHVGRGTSTRSGRAWGTRSRARRPKPSPSRTRWPAPTPATHSGAEVAFPAAGNGRASKGHHRFSKRIRHVWPTALRVAH